MREPVEVILDELGIAHVFARNEWDLRVAEGYFHARDRFVQMDLYRRTARGRLAELVGPDGIDSDAAMRTFGLGRAAEATVAEIASRAAGGDGEAADLLASMEAFAAGVNAYIAEITTGRVPPPALYTALLGRNPTSEEIPSWEPVDSFAIGKLESFDQSFSAYYDLIGEDHREKMLATFGEPGAPGVVPGREGFFWDMFRLEPAVEVSILPPAGGGRRHPLRKSSALGGKRSPTPDPLIEAAIERIEQAFRPLPLLDRTPLGSGSNNWVVSGRHTASGFPILANDTHMGLPVPTIFYQIHLNTAAQGGELDMAGVTIPGVPGILIGHTAYLAWGITNALVDVTDVYRERVVERDGEMAVLFDDPFDDPDEGTKEVPVRVIDRPIRVRDPETKELFEVPFTVKEVPHHGPILSEGGGEAISFRWSGLGATGESFTFPRLHRARTVEEAREAMRPYDVPPFSFVFADIEGRIAYSGQAYLPIRSEA
ncbi:MAG: penicillin acylase family protein, partial [Deltaproteobacteria bacterium]